jgi:glutamate racemase
MNNSENPIGIFDSGIGGISVLREIYHLMPEENYIYYGDSAHAPYGTKSIPDIKKLSADCMSFLLQHNAKAIVIACNTATSAAAAMLRKTYPHIPIIGIEPALKPAVLWKEHDKILVMATPMTLKQEKFQKLMHTYEENSDIYCVPCAGLVEFIERGELEGPALEEFIYGLLQPYLNSGIDAIVLGCTHYPFVQDTIQKVTGPNVRIFVGSYGTAKQLHRRLLEANLQTTSTTPGTVHIYNSNNSQDTIELCEKLLYL